MCVFTKKKEYIIIYKDLGDSGLCKENAKLQSSALTLQIRFSLQKRFATLDRLPLVVRKAYSHPALPCGRREYLTGNMQAIQSSLHHAVVGF